MPRTGDSYVNNRSLIQPPESYEYSNCYDSDYFSTETKDLISVLKQTKEWTYNSSNNEHPLFTYLKRNNDR